MDKLFQKHIARLLIIFIITVIFPTRTLAASENSIVTTAQEISENINIESEELEAKIVGEVKEKREQNIKYFLKDNMTYEAAIYGAPVHYNDNGEWKDIDNSLVEQKDENNNDILQNKENDFKVKISKNSNSSKLVRIEKGDFELSWNIENKQESAAVIKLEDLTITNTETENIVTNKLENNKNDAGTFYGGL